MKKYYLKVTALSPLHIGSGEDYDPTNFVIDNGMLYEFDEVDFYRKLPDNLQRELNAVASQAGPDILMKVHGFVKKNKKYAIEAAKNRISVSKGIDADYEKKIGKIVQQEGKGRGPHRNVFNQFQILRSQQMENLAKLYIPGSSVKGAISTAYQEKLYQKDPRAWEEKFKKAKPSMSVFKNFLISDLQPVKSNGMIGYAVNKERFEDDDQGPNNKLEVITPDSNYVCTLSFKDLDPELEDSMDTFMEACNDHYRKNLNSLFAEGEYTARYLSKEFIQKAKALQLGKESFLLRLGRHSGARAVTIEGIREIKIKESGGGKNRKPNIWETKEEETTVWLYAEEEHSNDSLLPFGWVLCSLIDADEYTNLLSNRDSFIKERNGGIIAQRRAYREAREARIREEAEAKLHREQEETKRLELERTEAERISSLSPIDRMIEENKSSIAVLVNKMKSGELENYENIKLELAKKIKILLEKDPKQWEKAKKKALDRKEFIESILK